MSDQKPKKQPEWLSGKLFLRPLGASWQRGRIDRRVNDDHYLIMVHSWVDGELSHMTIASVASMTDWKLYDINEGHDDWKREGERLLEEARQRSKENI